MNAATVTDLSISKLLAALSPDELRAAAPLFDVRGYPQGAILVSEGDRLERFHIVLVGRVKFFWRNDAGRQVEVAAIGPGEDFAAQALRGEPMQTTLIALDDLRVATISIASFEQLLLDHPRLALAYLKRVVGLFRNTMTARRAFSMDDVYARTTRLLLSGAVESDGLRVVAERLTHAAIGQRVGATREMVGRVLRDLARGGYIKVERGRISILRDLPARW